jgi:hypothetical protein
MLDMQPMVREFCFTGSVESGDGDWQIIVSTRRIEVAEELDSPNERQDPN